VSGSMTPPAILNRRPLARYEAAPHPPGPGARKSTIAMSSVLSRLVTATRARDRDLGRLAALCVMV